VGGTDYQQDTRAGSQLNGRISINNEAPSFAVGSVTADVGTAEAGVVEAILYTTERKNAVVTASAPDR
jgi:hypothetical protein